MDRKSSNKLIGVLTGSFLIIAFLYIAIIVRPDFYFHHVQAPFLFSPDFLDDYLTYPGGISELVANLFMQFFHLRLPGSVLLFGFAIAIMWLVHKVIYRKYPGTNYHVWAMVPMAFTIFLINNFNFPFSVVISIVFVLILLWLLAKPGQKLIGKILRFLVAAATIYYLSGGGYLMLFSLTALIITVDFKTWRSLVMVIVIPVIALVIPKVASGFLFAIPVEQNYLYLFPSKPYFMAYEPPVLFYIYLLSIPLIVMVAVVRSNLEKSNLYIDKGIPLMIGIALFFGHYATYRSDAKKITGSDYHCYHNHPEKVAAAATTLKNYSFAANLNYNIAMSKAGKLTDEFFNYFQISGTRILQPDIDFSSELSFLAADFYYDLGYISEARHWAYESLVYYPYSPRAMQLLVKVHLITGEYKAAERCLNIISKGLIGRKMLKTYYPYVQDTSLIYSNPELMEKRRCIPEAAELNPYIHQRFIELLEANSQNKRAYEYLMLYYLLDSQLENFCELFKEAGNYFDHPVGIYEEAILMHAKMNEIPVDSICEISLATMNRYQQFYHTADQYNGDKKMARNVLYWEMGKSYLYYLNYLYPRIIKPEIIQEEYEEPPI